LLLPSFPSPFLSLRTLAPLYFLLVAQGVRNRSLGAANTFTSQISLALIALQVCAFLVYLFHKFIAFYAFLFSFGNRILNSAFARQIVSFNRFWVSAFMG
jgi:hypothetical protein